MPKWLYQTSITDSEWTSSPSTWLTGVGTSATFGIRTPSLAPLISTGGVHDLHGDTLECLDASIPSLSPLSCWKLGRSGVAIASSLRRARAHSTMHRHPLKLAHSSTVSCSPTSTLKLAVKPSGEPTFPIFPKSGRRNCFLLRAQCWALRSLSSSLVGF